MTDGNEIKSYLHHVLPPLSITVVVGSIIHIFVLFLQVDVALAACLSDLTISSTHEDDAKDGESDRDRNEEVESDWSGVQASLFDGINCY